MSGAVPFGSSWTNTRYRWVAGVVPLAPTAVQGGDWTSAEPCAAMAGTVEVPIFTAGPVTVRSLPSTGTAYQSAAVLVTIGARL